jgi:hypothetical protein
VAFELTALSRAVGGVLRGARIGRAVGADRRIDFSLAVVPTVGERHVEIADHEAAAHRARHEQEREQRPQGAVEKTRAGHPLVWRNERPPRRTLSDAVPSFA